MNTPAPHKIGLDYTDIIKTRKNKRQLPLIARLAKKIDIARLQSEIQDMLQKHPQEIGAFNFALDPASTEHTYNLRNMKGELFVQNYTEVYKKYSAIGFQELSHEAKLVNQKMTKPVTAFTPVQRLRGMLNTTSPYYHPLYDERNYTLPTPYCQGYIKEILSSFENPSCRSALVVLRPGEFLSPHFDIGPEYVTRLQLPVFTNTDARIGVRDADGFWQEYHLPSDGHIYFVNAGYEHYAINSGSEPRFQIRICLNGQDDLKNCEAVEPTRTVTPEQFGEMPFAKTGTQTGSINEGALKEFNM